MSVALIVATYLLCAIGVGRLAFYLMRLGHNKWMQCPSYCHDDDTERCRNGDALASLCIGLIWPASIPLAVVAAIAVGLVKLITIGIDR